MAKGGLYGDKAYIQALEVGCIEMCNNIMEAVKDKAMGICPVDTGTLRAGYRVDKATSLTDNAVLSNDVEYHNYVNDGTPKMAPRAMIETAIASINPDARQYIRRK